MKLYYFMLIIVGLMYTFHLAGIETGSNNVLSRIEGLNLNSTDVVPELNDSQEYETRDIINANSWWWALTIALSVFVGINLAGSVKIFGSGFDASALTSAIIAGVATYICSLFTFDFFSLLLYMKEINCDASGCGWQFHLTWILIMPILFGFAFSLIEFIQGKD